MTKDTSSKSMTENVETPNNSFSRRKFIKQTALGLAGATAAFSARSYARILGANDRIHFVIAGLNGRGKALIGSVSSSKNTQISTVCDVDSRLFSSIVPMVNKLTGVSPTTQTDYRVALEQKHIDAIAIATPDHWHTPMALHALDAGKHVYVEKPCSHNPNEGELLVAAQKKHKNLVVQMGNQQRSAPTSIQAMIDIQAGLIGEAYYAKTWYSNNRTSIGHGKKVAPPAGLDWDLWQGPAPRTEYQDNLVHYNWHWFWNWGTGEVNNNGAHELDIARWALGVNYPTKVNSTGGRFHFKDDWQFYDTQVANYEFEGGKAISWEGRSCNGFKHYQRGRGTTIHGRLGTILLDRNIYQAFNLDGKIIKEVKETHTSETTNIVGAGALDVYHMDNFLSVIREGVKQNSPILEGHKSVLMCHLANIAQKTGSQLTINPTNGHIIQNAEAQKLWSREYAPGWQPVV